MKHLLIFLLGILPHALFSQAYQKSSSFYEAKKAMEARKNGENPQDSLKQLYDGRWTVDLTYGQRFISSYNKSSILDTLTLTDFSDKRAFYGLGTQYFISNKLSVGFGLEFLFLPKKQNITSFTGSGGSGEGSGGLIFTSQFIGKYFFTSWGIARPYLALDVGLERLTAKGGTVNFSFFSGRNEDINTLTKNVFFGTLSAGISHRLALGSILDFKIGYSHTTRSDPIGGITSPGGLKASLSLQFVLNPYR